MKLPICQSCSISMKKDEYGSNDDNSKIDKYCKYCFSEGKFTNDFSLDEEIKYLIPMYIDGREISEKEAYDSLYEILVKLDRWK